MEPNGRRSPSYQAGFTLVEIMVGLGIGMLATVVIIQVLSVFEAQRRTTTGTADAQTNGGIALYNIGRELQMAGYPLMPVTDSAIECTTLTVNGVAATPNHLSPVTIADNVVGTGVNASPSDTITIRYGSVPIGGVATVINGVPTMINAAPTGNDANVDNNLGCQFGDNTLIISGPTCAMSSVNAPVLVAKKVTLTNPTGANVVGANLACLGAWHEVTYRVNGGNLERQDLAISNSFVPSVAGIVNLQVQYGISAIANSITQWVDATSGGTWAAPTDAASTVAAPTVPDRNRIKAVRIAVVARNAKIEPDVVTAACSSTTAAAPTGLCAWDATSAAPSIASPAPAIDLSAGDPNWLHYRYRVFETIIPLRNVVWSKDTLP
jgi:type IV pilus assembly protein PilW